MKDSDAISIAAALRGDACAVEALILRHQRRAHAIARAHGVPSASVDDVVQESFLIALRDLRCLRDPKRFGPWLLAIVRNAARRFHRARGRAMELATLPELSGPEPHDPIEADELRERLWRRVAELSPALRETVLLYYYEGHSVREVARILEVSRATVRKRLQEGRDALRGRLWRDLEDELREMLPSVREWRRRARELSLLAVASLPAVSSSATSASSVSGQAAAIGSGSAFSTPIFAGVAVMTFKKVTLTGAALAVVFGTVWIFRESGTRPDAPIPSAAARDPVTRPKVDSTTAPTEPSLAVAGTLPAAVESAAIEPVAVEPPRRPAVVVQVVGQDGEPLADAALRALWEQESLRENGERVVEPSIHEQPEPSAAAEFVLEERRANTVFLVADAPLHLSTNRKIDVPEDSLADPVVLELEYVGVLDFRLIAPLDGDRPVAGATIGYIKNRPEMIGSPLGFPPPHFSAKETVPRVHEVMSDADGNFSIGYALGTLWITAEGFGPTSVTLHRNAVQGSGQRRSIPMYPPTVLAIEVSRSDDVPVREFRYGLARDIHDLHGPFPRHADGQRVEYELYHDCLLEPQARMLDTIGLGISAGDLETRRRVRLELGTTNDVRAILAASQTRIAGRVLAEGEVPVADARVTAVSGEKRQAIYNERIAWRGANSTRSAADGTYELTLPADVPSVNLVVEASGSPCVSAPRVGRLPTSRSVRSPAVSRASRSVSNASSRERPIRMTTTTYSWPRAVIPKRFHSPGGLDARSSGISPVQTSTTQPVRVTASEPSGICTSYEITVYLTDPAPRDECTVDITPRRLVHFRPLDLQ